MSILDARWAVWRPLTGPDAGPHQGGPLLQRNQGALSHRGWRGGAHRGEGAAGDAAAASACAQERGCACTCERVAHAEAQPGGRSRAAGLPPRDPRGWAERSRGRSTELAQELGGRQAAPGTPSHAPPGPSSRQAQVSPSRAGSPEGCVLDTSQGPATSGQGTPQQGCCQERRRCWEKPPTAR